MATITVSTVTIPSWQGNPSGIQLRLFNNVSFTAEGGTIYPQSVLANGQNIGTFFQIFPCVDSGSPPTLGLTIPEIVIDSTTDSPDVPTATYTAILWDTNQSRMVQVLGTFSVPSTGTATATETLDVASVAVTVSGEHDQYSYTTVTFTTPVPTSPNATYDFSGLTTYTGLNGQTLTPFSYGGDGATFDGGYGSVGSGTDTGSALVTYTTYTTTWAALLG